MQQQSNINEMSDQALYNALMNDPAMKGLGMPTQDTTTQFTAPILSSAYDKNFLMFSLDSGKDLINKIEHYLRNEYYNENTKKFESRGDALINEYGINRLLTILRPFLDKNFALSYYDAQDIEKTIKAIAFLVTDTLYNEWESFGLTDKNNPEEANLSAIMSVYEIIVNNAYSNLLRAKDGFTMKTIRSVYKAEDKDQPSAKKGILGGLNPFSKKGY